MLRGDKIYAYEPGVLQLRYEGIVHKVQMLDVELGFDMNEYVVHSLKYIMIVRRYHCSQSLA